MTKKLSIMLVEDNEIDLFLHEKFLLNKKITSQILKFLNAIDALEYLDEKKDEGWPDVILLDILMPGMDAFDFLDHYEKLPEERREKCNVIVVSSAVDFGDVSRARANMQVLEVLKKPLSMKDLIALLEQNGLA